MYSSRPIVQTTAFDTVDHSILLSRMNSYFGNGGVALYWFQSYLSGRTYCVCIDNVTSDISQLKYGLPQGSVLGPIRFSMYTSRLISCGSMAWNIIVTQTILKYTFQSILPKYTSKQYQSQRNNQYLQDSTENTYFQSWLFLDMFCMNWLL